MKRVLWETLAVGLGGLMLALLLNWVSPRGISLARDYFPNASFPAPNASGVTNPAGASPGSNNLQAVSDEISVRLAAKGFQVADPEKAWKLYNEPAYHEGRILFIDARNDDEYARGHIPGAYQLDYYRPEKYLPVVLPATLAAETILVYCNGGECEDSEFTALMLRQSGIAAEKIFVFAGGFAAWAAKGWPVELQSRHSGVMKGQP